MTFTEKWNDAWEGFQAGKWNKEVNLRDFIQLNYTPYDGDDSFLAGPTQNTKDLWAQVMDLTKQEREAGGVLDMDTKVVSTLTSHDAGYLDRLKKQLLVFKLTNLLRDLYNHLVVFVLLNKHVKQMVTK